MRDLVKLVCADCKNENYYTDKNKKTTPERMEIKKYCPHCRKHTVHKEKKLDWIQALWAFFHIRRNL